MLSSRNFMGLCLIFKSLNNLQFIFVYGVRGCYDLIDLHVAIQVVWKRQWHLTPVLLLGKSHGWRSLVGCSPWNRTESDTTERLNTREDVVCTVRGSVCIKKSISFHVIVSL